MWRTLALAIALPIGACSTPEPPADRDGYSQTESLLSPEQRRTAQLSARWLVGHWDHRSDCPPGSGGTSLWEDGIYTMSGGSGRWSLAGNVVTVTEERPPDAYLFQARLGDEGQWKVKIVGPDTISVQWGGGPVSFFYRCDPSSEAPKKRGGSRP